MIRRRRPVREIHFSFDSFLDVVANVVGIILRLILVAWMGARTYKGPPPTLPTSAPGATEIGKGEPLSLPEPHDPLADELDQQRQILARAQKQLLQQLREWQQARKEREAVTGEITQLTDRRRHLEKERQEVRDQFTRERGKTARDLSLSLDEFQKRSRQLLTEIDALKKQPSAKQVLRYRTPVSQPIQTDELLFECQRGRVTLIDIAAFKSELQRDVREKIDRLRDQWSLEEVTQPVGAFRMRYVVERQRSGLENLGEGIGPNKQAGFSVSISRWQAEPVLSDRGEPVERALAAGSDFRRIIDNLDPNETVVTFWVYPDSFPQYRRLRDYLHAKDVVVAGRPLPEGVLVGGSPEGTASRGQ